MRNLSLSLSVNYGMNATRAQLRCMIQLNHASLCFYLITIKIHTKISILQYHQSTKLSNEYVCLSKVFNLLYIFFPMLSNFVLSSAASLSFTIQIKATLVRR